MVGYGVTNNSNDPSKNFNTTLPISHSEDFTTKTKPQPKKELTLQEKQKLASQFENNTSSKKEMSNSFSMQGVNKQKSSNSDLLSDNLMSSNLASLSFSNSTSQQNGIQQNILPISNSPCK